MFSILILQQSCPVGYFGMKVKHCVFLMQLDAWNISFVGKSSAPNVYVNKSAYQVFFKIEGNWKEKEGE